MIFCILILVVSIAYAAIICPNCGAKNQEGDKYCIKCGEALPNIRIPSVVDLSLDKAIQKLKDLGLRVKVDSVQGQKSGIVIDQSPDAGAYRSEGNTVKITVSISSPGAKWVEKLKQYEGWPVPGKEAAGISIGYSEDSVIKTLGEPTTRNSLQNSYIWEDKDGDRLTIILKNNIVDTIVVWMNDSLRKDIRNKLLGIVLKGYIINTDVINKYPNKGINFFVESDSSISYFEIFSPKTTPGWIKILKDFKTDFLKRKPCLGITVDSVKSLFGEPQIENSYTLKYIDNDNNLIFSLVDGVTDTVNTIFSQELLDSLSLPKTFNEIKNKYGNPTSHINDEIIYVDAGITIGLNENNDINYIKVYHPEYEDMALIPAGLFLLGVSDEDIKDMNKTLKSMNMEELKIDKSDIEDEMPRQIISLDGFYIDKYEVTNEQFQKFVNATNYKSQGNWENWYKTGQENYPVRGITRYDANTYAEWLGKELPTEFQWESAAKGGGGYIFPWGNSFDATGLANYQKNDYQNTSTVMPVDNFSMGQSTYGVYNMAGNVREWCRNDYIDITNYYKKIPKINPQGTATEIKTEKDLPEPPFPASIRGGSYKTSLDMLRCSYRDNLGKSEHPEDVGFRCIKEIKH